MVESDTAVPVSRAPPTHAASDSEMLVALRDAASSLRIACDDPHPYGRGAGEKCLERHVLLAVRLISPQAPSIRSMIVDAFAQGSRPCYVLQQVLQHIIRSLCHGLSLATPDAVMQEYACIAFR